MIELINKMKINYNMTFIIATHDERLCDLADKIYYLNNHKLTLNKDEWLDERKFFKRY